MSSGPTRYTIIPDVHGRPFWRDAVLDVDTTPVVFLGDYLDPYPQDGVVTRTIIYHEPIHKKQT